MYQYAAIQPENGLNINASPWKGPVSLQLGTDSPNETPLSRALTQPTAQLSLYPPSMDVPSYRARPICKFFLAGGCSRGDACQFLHELPKDSTLAENTDSATSVTGIVFNLNAKNTFSALHKQTMGEMSGLGGQENGTSDRGMYGGEYSPVMNDLSQNSSEYYSTYPANMAYTSQYNSGGGWSNQLASEVDTKPRRAMSSTAYTAQYDSSSTYTRGIAATSQKNPYGAYYAAQHYASAVSENATQTGSGVTRVQTQQSSSNDVYWPSGTSGEQYTQESAENYQYYASYADEKSPEEASLQSQTDARKATGPMSYAAVAQKQKLAKKMSFGLQRDDSQLMNGSESSTNNAGIFSPHDDTEAFVAAKQANHSRRVSSDASVLYDSPARSTHLKTPSPIRSDLKPNNKSKHASGTSDEIEPPWKPIAKPSAKGKHAEKSANNTTQHQGKQAGKGRKSNEPITHHDAVSDKARRTPEGARLSPRNMSHHSIGSHKIQLPNPLIWSQRVIPDPIKRNMQTIVCAITGSHSPYDIASTGTPGSAESDYLRQPTELNLDGLSLGTNTKQPTKGKGSSPLHTKGDGKPNTSKSIRGSQKVFTIDHMKEKKERAPIGHNAALDLLAQRGSRNVGRGRGYGGQAYHETKIPVDSERK